MSQSGDAAAPEGTPPVPREVSRRYLLSQSAAAGVAVASVGGLIGARNSAIAETDKRSTQSDPPVNVRDHGAAGNGTADDTRAIQAAVDVATNGPGEIFFPVGQYLVTTPITLSSGLSVRGAGTGKSTILATHAGAVFTTSTPAVRTFAWAIADLRLTGPGAGTAGSVALDLDSVSTSHLQDTVVSDFETGVRIRSAQPSGAVYNRLTNVTAEKCMTGFSVEPKGSNASTFDGCRANSCTTYGVAVTDSNNTSLIMCQIEGCGTGLHVTATSNALSDATIAVACRFEGNGVAWEAANNFVRDMTVVYPAAFTPYRVIDNGSRTQHWGTGSYVTQKAQSQLQSATGSWRFERIIDGGAQFPALVVSDTATGAGIPVTIQAETEQPGGYAFRAIRAGLTYWDVDASGNMRFPEGGYIELSKREGDPEIPLPNTARLYLRDDGGGRAQLCARFASGAVQVISTEP